jgi:hypothetical protein
MPYSYQKLVNAVEAQPLYTGRRNSPTTWSLFDHVEIKPAHTTKYARTSHFKPVGKLSSPYEESRLLKTNGDADSVTGETRSEYPTQQKKLKTNSLGLQNAGKGFKTVAKFGQLPNTSNDSNPITTLSNYNKDPDSPPESNTLNDTAFATGLAVLPLSVAEHTIGAVRAIQGYKEAKKERQAISDKLDKLDHSTAPKSLIQAQKESLTSELIRTHKRRTTKINVIAACRYIGSLVTDAVKIVALAMERNLGTIVATLGVKLAGYAMTVVIAPIALALTLLNYKRAHEEVETFNKNKATLTKEHLKMKQNNDSRASFFQVLIQHTHSLKGKCHQKLSKLGHALEACGYGLAFVSSLALFIGTLGAGNVAMISALAAVFGPVGWGLAGLGACISIGLFIYGRVQHKKEKRQIEAWRQEATAYHNQIIDLKEAVKINPSAANKAELKKAKEAFMLVKANLREHSTEHASAFWVRNIAYELSLLDRNTRSVLCTQSRQELKKNSPQQTWLYAKCLDQTPYLKSLLQMGFPPNWLKALAEQSAKQLIQISEFSEFAASPDLLPEQYAIVKQMNTWTNQALTGKLKPKKP